MPGHTVEPSSELPVPLRPRSHPRRRGRRLYQTLVIVALVLVALAFADGFVKLANIRYSILELQAQKESWQQKIDGMKAEIDKLNNPEHIEELARDRLGLVKPGESLILVAEPAGDGEGPLTKRNAARRAEIRD